MRFQIKKDVLYKTIKPVLNVVSTKTTLPILLNILIDVEKDRIHFSSTDLDIAMTTTIQTSNSENINIEEAGSITIPGKRIGEILDKLPNEKIVFSSLKNNILRMDCQKCFFRLIGLPREDFPKIPVFSETNKIKIEQKKLKEALTLTSCATSRETERYGLNGIFFEFMKDTIRFVATDGRRLAYVDKKITPENKIEKNITVPTKTINEIQRIIEESGDVEISLTDNQICFSTNIDTFQSGVSINLNLISRILDAQFPDYKQVIPKQGNKRIHLKTQEWLGALKRAALFTTIDDPAIKLDIMKNKLVISKITPDIGEIREEIDTNYKAEEISIGFVPHYLIDVVKNLPDEEIDIDIVDTEVGKVSVVKIKDGQGMDYFHMVLPIALE
ncbi:DNA polymerase III subunit beta [bacterium Unc6]|nr:DNA polymerase III subunit beta [bacterium Unc6]